MATTNGHFTGDFQKDFEHTGPGTLAGRYLRQFWLAFDVAGDVAPGRAKPITFMNEKLTFYRGKSGKPHLVAAKCAHRAAQLSAGWIEDDCVRCQYHGWKFDGTGQCVEQPGEEPGYAAKIRIPAYPVREHVGLLWTYMGEGELPAWPPFPEPIHEGLDEAFLEVFPSNYLCDIENDNYHAYWTHRTSGLAIRNSGAETILNNAYNFTPSKMAETDFGIEQVLQAEGRKTCQLYTTPASFFIFPGAGGPDWYLKRAPRQDLRTTLVFKIPIDDDSHNFIVSQRVRLKPQEVDGFLKLQGEYRKVRATTAPAAEVAQQILDGKLTWDDVRDYPYLIAVEDMVSQMGEGKLSERPTEHLGRTDTDLIFRRRVYERELKALAEGRPVKQWRPITSWDDVYDWSQANLPG